jgi:hypothetical protein
MKFIASSYANQITYRRLSKQDERWPRGTFHDTWEEAHATIVERCRKQFELAERERKRAQSAFIKAKAMQKPTPPRDKES